VRRYEGEKYLQERGDGVMGLRPSETRRVVAYKDFKRLRRYTGLLRVAVFLPVDLQYYLL
jgi:hypothetical protein